ncbi:AraC family transcriptional regulator [Paenibacillus sp. HB172176]|uniref:helix-turn-helix transcriptional regulator n=1 Tax=Paenibacillus sp. HB172176 TaxID=2493690 RepID=UPI00143AD796|nr:AraC family transcriptional regulator [Paenibacillus sp. HB172176]
MLLPYLKPLSGKVVTRYRWIAAAALLAIIPVVILSLAMYAAAHNSLLNEIEMANRLLMKQVQERTDQILVTVDRSVSQHVTNDQLSILLHEGSLEDNERELAHVMATLAAMEILIEHVDAVYLYMVDADKLVTVDGVVDHPEAELGASFYSALLHNRELAFWYDHIQKNNSGIANADGWQMIDGLWYARKLPSGLSEPLGYYVVRLQKEALYEVFQNTVLDEPVGMFRGGLLAVSPDGNIYADSPLREFIEIEGIPGEVADWMNNKVIPSKVPLSVRMKIAGDTMLLHAWPSTDSGWIYISVIPYEQLIASIKHVRRIAVGASLIVAFAALLTSLLFSNRIYGRIRTVIERLQMENEVLGEEVRESAPERQMYFVNKWLRQSLDQEEFDRMKQLGFPMSGYVYTAFCIEKNYVGQGERGTPAWGRTALEILQRESLGSMPASVQGVFFSRIGEDLIGGVVVQSHEQSELLRSHLQLLGEQLLQWLDGRLALHSTLIMGFGSQDKSAAKLYQSFEQAQHCLKQILLRPDMRIFVYDSGSMETQPPTYPFEHERMIIMHLRLGEQELAAAELHRFAESLLMHRVLIESQVRTSFLLLLTSIMRLVPEDHRLATDILQPLEWYEKLQSFRLLPELLNWLHTDVFVKLIEQNRRTNRQEEEQKGRPSDGITEKILDYVRHHYDEDISLTVLSDLFGLPEAQISQLFRKQAGITFTEYVTSIRISRAKELLLATDMKVADIACRMRYNNAQNFIRVFKRVTGVTPGEFRKRESQ